MKKVTGKLIAIVLAMTMVVSMSGVAFADVGSRVDDMQKTKVSIDKNAAKPSAKAKPASIEGVETLPVKTLEDSSTSKAAYMTWELEPNMYGVAAVTAPTTGYIYFDYKMTGAITTDRVEIMLFENYDDEYGYDVGAMCPGEEFFDQSGIFANKGQTYYIFFMTSENNKGTITISSRAGMYSNVSNRTLPAYTNANKYLWASPINKTGTGSSDLYYKVIPNKTGLMTVNLKAYGETVGGVSATQAKVTLYNANKVALSQSVQYNSNKAATKAYFGVTKGKVYYIRVQNCYDFEGNMAPKYGIRYGMTAYTDRYLPTNAKALQLKKGAAVTRTLFTANNATGTDTYKIYVPKTQVAKITVNTQNIRSGNITVKVYNYNGKQVGTAKTIYPNHISNTYTITYGTVKGKASKGTYYIKLTKGAKVSGQYSIKYNK